MSPRIPVEFCRKVLSSPEQSLQIVSSQNLPLLGKPRWPATAGIPSASRRSQLYNESEPQRLSIQFAPIVPSSRFPTAQILRTNPKSTRSGWPICKLGVDRLVASIKGARPGQITAPPLSPFPPDPGPQLALSSSWDASATGARMHPFPPSARLAFFDERMGVVSQRSSDQAWPP